MVDVLFCDILIGRGEVMGSRLTKKAPEIKESISKDGFKVKAYYCPECGKLILSTKNGSVCGTRTRCCSDCGQELTWKGVELETYWPCDEMD